MCVRVRVCVDLPAADPTVGPIANKDIPVAYARGGSDEAKFSISRTTRTDSSKFQF